MDGEVAGFDWDASNREHCRKHGVSIVEIEDLLMSGPRIAPDLKHARIEDRLIAVGRTIQGRPIFVAFTIREQSGREQSGQEQADGKLIRPVSARYMHPKEIERYEAQGF